MYRNKRNLMMVVFANVLQGFTTMTSVIIM